MVVSMYRACTLKKNANSQSIFPSQLLLLQTQLECFLMRNNYRKHHVGKAEEELHFRTESPHHEETPPRGGARIWFARYDVLHPTVTHRSMKELFENAVPNS
jgi:hypothetical protein